MSVFSFIIISINRWGGHLTHGSTCSSMEFRCTDLSLPNPKHQVSTVMTTIILCHRYVIHVNFSKQSLTCIAGYYGHLMQTSLKQPWRRSYKLFCPKLFFPMTTLVHVHLIWLKIHWLYRDGMFSCLDLLPCNSVCAAERAIKRQEIISNEKVETQFGSSVNINWKIFFDMEYQNFHDNKIPNKLFEKVW
jgi:hypothetical protein